MAITFEKVNFVYFPKTPFQYQALNDISLTFEQGKFYGIVGETGSGKSTLVQNINGLLLPTEGVVKVDDYIVSSNKRKVEFKKIRKKCGLVFQFPEYQLFEETVLKDVMFGPKNFKISEKEATEAAVKALKTVGIDESLFNKSPFELSGGQKRRVAIAGILAMDPEVIVLDEPTAGLDPVGSEEIMEIFRMLNEEEKKTIILISHDMNIVYEYCENIVVLNKGNVCFDGKKTDLFKDLKLLKDFHLDEPDIERFKSSLTLKGFNFEKDKTFSLESLVTSILKEVKS